MKSWKHLLTGALAMAILAGCGNDEPVGPDPVTPDEQQSLYMNVGVALPSARGTRSQTDSEGNSTGGTEVGKDYENTVKTLLLVLSRNDDKYVAHTLVTGLNTGNKTTITTTAAFKRTDVQKFYDADGKLPENRNKIHVYAFCNPTAELTQLFEGLNSSNDDGSWVNTACKVLEGTTSQHTEIWEPGSFLMSNAAIAEKTIPNTFQEWVVKYTSEASPFELSGKNNGGINNDGAIKVERSVARLDFKDGSPTQDRTYPIGIGEDEGTMKVELLRMALVNMSNEFYYLRRVSDDGLAADAVLCGQETDANYVVDTDAAFKEAIVLSSIAGIGQLKDHFNFRLFDDNGEINDNTRKQWYSERIVDVLENEEDNDEGWKPAAKSDYRIWRYVTENTIPTPEKRQVSGLSTGIIFKGKLKAGDNLETKHEDLYKAISGTFTQSSDGYTYEVQGKHYPILFEYKGTLYVGWNNEVVKKAQEEYATDTNSELYKAAMENNENGNPNTLYQALVAARNTTNEEKALTAFRKAATTAGFTLYQASDDGDGITDGAHDGVGYYFYYYYWNRHNDNQLPGTMGTMEFGTVRNNVYKLAVTNIRKLGHPRISDNDPDPTDPEDPDENGDLFITVSVEVLPWVVRENNIEF